MKQILKRNILYIIWLLLLVSECYCLGRFKGQNDALEDMLHLSVSQTNEFRSLVERYRLRGDSMQHMLDSLHRLK